MSLNKSRLPKALIYTGSCIYLIRPAATISNPNNDLNDKNENFVVLEKPKLKDAVSTSVTMVDFTTNLSTSNPLISYNTDNVQMSIKEFLSRPIICPNGSFVWSPASVVNTNLMDMPIPGTMFDSTTMWGKKLDGVYGFKGTLVVKLQANCQKFQSGILLLSIIPAAGHILTTRINLINSDIAYKSQLPSVRYNINELDEVEIRVPFTSPELFHNTTFPLNWARVLITVYSPVVGGNVNCTCWCSFEDVELHYPTTQSGFSVSGKKKTRVAFSDQEDEGGMLSAPLASFSRAFGSVATNIPSLSSIAAPTEWFLRACSKAVSAFGYSSVVDTETRKSVVLRTSNHMNNCDVNDTADSMGLMASNKVAVLPGFAGNDIDEMSIQYISQIPMFIRTFPWSNISPYSTELATFTVSPLSNYINKTITPSAGPAVSAYTFPPCGYVASSFNFWRGSLVYRFFASKTDFHTGRILFTFIPSVNGSAAASFGDNQYVYKWIWDLRDSHSFEITIPYVNSVPWSSTFIDGYNWTGILKAFVLNPLNAPATVSSSINIITEMRAGEDFEVAGLTQTQNWAPIIAYAGEFDASYKNRKFRHREPYFFDKDKELEVVKKNKIKNKNKIKSMRLSKYDIFAQSGLTVSQQVAEAHIPDKQDFIGNPDRDTDGFTSMYTMGETVKSIKQILKRSSLMWYERYGASFDSVVYFNPFISYISNVIDAGSNEPIAAVSPIRTDLYTKFASMFALRRGGVIIRAINSSDRGLTVATLQPALRIIDPFYYDNTGAGNFGYSDVNSQVLTINNLQGSEDLLIPFYSSTASAPVFTKSIFGSITDTRYYANHINLKLQFDLDSAQTNNTLAVQRKVADDFQLGAFLGTLPVYGSPKTLQ